MVFFMDCFLQESLAGSTTTVSASVESCLASQITPPPLLTPCGMVRVASCRPGSARDADEERLGQEGFRDSGLDPPIAGGCIERLPRLAAVVGGLQPRSFQGEIERSVGADSKCVGRHPVQRGICGDAEFRTRAVFPEPQVIRGFKIRCGDRAVDADFSAV